MKTNIRGTECYAPCSFKYSGFSRVVQNVLLDWLKSTGEAVDILHYATSDELASDARLKTAVELLLSCLHKCIISSFPNKWEHDRFSFYVKYEWHIVNDLILPYERDLCFVPFTCFVIAVCLMWSAFVLFC